MSRVADHGDSETAVLQARIDELEGERERLRRRTHEIQEAADKKMGKLESQVAQYRNRFTAARDRVAPWVATWTTDPPSQERFGWWRYASQDQVDEITALVSEVRDAQAERDRLREAARTVSTVWRAGGPDAALSAAIADLADAAGLREQG